MGSSSFSQTLNFHGVGKGASFEQHQQGSAVGIVEEAGDQGGGQGFDPSGWCIDFCPCFEKSAQAQVDFSVAVGVAGVFGPQGK